MTYSTFTIRSIFSIYDPILSNVVLNYTWHYGTHSTPPWPSVALLYMLPCSTTQNPGSRRIMIHSPNLVAVLVATEIWVTYHQALFISLLIMVLRDEVTCTRQIDFNTNCMIQKWIVLIKFCGYYDNKTFLLISW